MLENIHFTLRIVNTWNSLPNFVVDVVDCINTFKTHLDKLWQKQAVKFDFKVEFTGTGGRSEFDSLTVTRTLEFLLS